MDLTRKSLFLVMFASILILSACTNGNGKTQSLEEFYKDEKMEHIETVVIQDGSTGASKTIINHEQIDEFLALVNEIEFTPQENQEKRDGWRYGLTLFDGEKEFKFTLEHINNTYYDSNPDIHPIVDTYYKQLDIVED